MMVPRSYPYLLSTSPSLPRQNNLEKMGAQATKSRLPSPQRKTSAGKQGPDKKRSESMSNMEPSPVTRAPPTHSLPVVIPPRTPTSAPATQTIRVRGQHGGRGMRVPTNHKPDAIPPAVAALLAVTAIPPMPLRRKRRPTRDRSVSMDELIQEWKQDDSDVSISVVGSPLDVLLDRVDESEDDYGSVRSLEQEMDSVVSRSISSDSISSTIPPSLDPDAPSFVSNWDALSTPESYTRRSAQDRRERIVSSPPKEDCILDHPLLHFSPDDAEDLADLDMSDLVASPAPSNARFKSFKSNLTASLQALKSAAKSFSNFTAPSVPPDDLLTRSLLTPKFTSEMRPRYLQGLPSPALRRYLNPQPTSISPSELSMHLHDSLSLEPEAEPLAPMIQMQTYDRRHNRSARRSRKTSPDMTTEAGRAIGAATPAVRQREPRENSDFLRVIVLEMNMRRVGKLDAKAVGRARIWLPPRKGVDGRSGSEKESGVPERWVARLVDEA